MNNCVYCQKKMLLKIILSVLNKKPAEIAREANVSKSLVSKYLAGERGSIDLDIYFIEKVFLIHIKDYIKDVK